MDRVLLPRVTNTTLTLRIQLALQQLLPLFEVTDQELESFEKPRLRRTLRDDEYPDHSRNVPAYSSIDNFIYFPELDTFKSGPSLYSMCTVRHEVGHYVHAQLNPLLRDGAEEFLRTGANPEGYFELIELVADYGNMRIMGDRYPQRERFNQKMFRFFQQNRDILPRLARMSLEEARDEGIVKAVDYYKP